MPHITSTLTFILVLLPWIIFKTQAQNAPPPQFQFTKLLGTTGDDESFSVASTSVGNSVYIAGYTFGNLGGNTNAGGYDIFLSRFSSTQDGENSLLWTSLLGSSSNDFANSASVSQDGSAIYVAGIYIF